MDNFHQPVPSFFESLSSDVKLQGVGDQHIFDPINALYPGHKWPLFRVLSEQLGHKCPNNGKRQDLGK